MGWSDFSKVRKIGEGSFGKAWLVRNHRDQISYVIKEISISRMPLRERDEARKEVAVLAQMKHPNIVSYIDSFEELGNLCIVMDYCDGGDLYSRITSQRNVGFSEDQILDWFVQITLALKHVHDRKILHRDLKSQNIFLTKDGVIKLGDFGVAKILANTMELARTAIGTPYYMSPEICESKPYNNKSDVWSLGCVLYELANLKHPFEANDVKNLIMKIIRGIFEPLRAVYSYDLRNLVASMLKRDPRERPSVNGILRKAFIMKRCQKFLTNEKLEEEFSHTVLHGEKIAKKIQQQRPASAISNAPRPISRPSSAMSPIIKVPSNNNLILGAAGIAPVPKASPYDPAKIYKNPISPVKKVNPLLRKSVERKAGAIVVAKKLKDVDNNIMKRPVSALDRRKSQDEVQPKKQIDSLLEKQKQERIKKARENGWQSVLSNSYENPENELQETIKAQNIDVVKKSPDENMKNFVVDNPPYHNYFQQLEQFNAKAKEKLADKNPVKVPVKVVPYKSPLVNDYLERKAAAARNKARGMNYLPNKPVVMQNIAKNKIQENLLETLNKIRMQNLNNKIEKNPLSKPKDLQDDNFRDNRLKQIAALKKQSEEQAKKIQKELEKRRFDALEREQQQWKQHIDEKLGLRKPVQNQAQKDCVKKPFGVPAATPCIKLKPEVPVNMTEALNAIGVVNEKNKNLKQIKEDILKNINEIEVRRKIWQDATDLAPLDLRPLAESVEPPKDAEKARCARKGWDQPHETILNAFEMASLHETSIQSNQAANKTFVIKTDYKQSADKVDTNSTQNDNTKTFENNTNQNTSEYSLDLLLNVTMGQFDLINTKLLRTCSEPDLNKLFPICEEERGDNTTDMKDLKKPNVDVEIFPDKKNSTMTTKTQKLAKSLDDFTLGFTSKSTYLKSIKITDSIIEKLIANETLGTKPNDQTFFGDFDDDNPNIYDKSASDDNDDDDADDDGGINDNNDEDVNEVAETMKDLLKEELVEPQADKSVKASVKAKLVVAKIAEKTETKSKDKGKNSIIVDGNIGNGIECATINDSMSVTLVQSDSDSGSDTEFEDDLLHVLQMQDQFHLLEEKREILEKELGAQKFIQVYKSIESFTNDSVSLKQIRNDCESFRTILPENKQHLYDEIVQLVVADSVYKN